MLSEHINVLVKLMTCKGIQFENGLSNEEIKAVEESFAVSFPPDLQCFLQYALPVSPRFVNWRKGLNSDEEKESIISRINWPLDGLLFDIHNDSFWREQWGRKPENTLEMEEIATIAYRDAPKLIPIYAHRFIPSSPNEEGNPIFSVHQTDIIHYGYDLISYFANEFFLILPEDIILAQEPKFIPFWSEVMNEY